MTLPGLDGFNLAGGTSLALQLGHRISYDLDLFGNRPFEHDEILELAGQIGNVRPVHYSKNIFILDIDGVKVDFVNYKYPWLRPVEEVDGLRLVGLPDIAAMKISAISGRGKKRDFIDLFFLLKKFALAELMGFYSEKYPDGNEMIAVRSLTYFADADSDDDLNLLKKAQWPAVKTAIEKEVRKMYG